MRVVISLAVFLLIATTAASAQETRTFENPMVDEDYRLDLCLSWGADCGEPSATAFCEAEGFNTAAKWEVANDIGDRAPTKTLKDGLICDEGFCDGFSSVTCEAPATALAQMKSLTAIPLDNGSRVEFLELEPGVVLVVEQGEWPATPALPRLDLDEDATPADLYRALAPDQPVPETIQVATLAVPEEEEPEPDIANSGEEIILVAKPVQPRLQGEEVKPVIQAKRAKPVGKVPAQPSAKPGANNTPKEEPADLPPTNEAKNRADWFQKEFCHKGSGRDVSWCWLNRQGRTNYSVWSIGIGATVYSCQGTTRFVTQYKRFGKWKTYGSYDVLPGHYVSFGRLGVPRTRRSVAEGACYHHSGVGVKL